MRNVSAYTSLVLLAVLFIGLVYINNQLLGQYRIDLTENQVYSLSEGSEAVISDIEEPVSLYFFFSETYSLNCNFTSSTAHFIQGSSICTSLGSTVPPPHTLNEGGAFG